jgi:two-component system, response regulator RegA
MRILVVDDDVTFRERLCKALSRRGHDVEQAGCVAGARRVVETAGVRFEGCIVDLRLPGESGLEFVHWLGDLCPACSILVLTGFGSIATAVQAIRLGATDYLTKPADADQILGALLRAKREEARDAVEDPAFFPSLDRVEWEHMQRVLQECAGNISMAARKLGIERRTLQRKLQKLPPRN